MLQTLKVLDDNADVSQHDLARELKSSLGSANYCINARRYSGAPKYDP